MSNVSLIDNFRENLIRACTERKISQAELARRSGVHSVTVNRIFKGYPDVSVSTCEKLAIAAGIRTDTIFLQPEHAA